MRMASWCAVLWLHGRVGEVRGFVNGFDLFGGGGESGGDVAILTAYGARLLREGDPLFADIGGVDIGVRAFVPFDDESVARLNGVPRVVGDQSDAG
jgi:hypothetical protein